MESVLSILRSKVGKTLLLLTALIQPIEAFSANACTIKEMPICLDNTPCKVLQDPLFPNNPSKTIEVCLSTSPKFGAMTSTASCWDWAASYDCLDPNAIRGYIDQCIKIKNGKNADGTPVCPDYQEVASKCAEPLSTNGSCPAFDVTYRCTTAAGQQYQEQTCGGVTLCQGGTCAIRDKEQSTSLSKVAAAAEAARQAGTYLKDQNLTIGDPNSVSIFAGVPDNCSQNTLGLSDCCVPNAEGKNQSNQAITQTLMSLGFSLWIQKTSGSMYTFDALYDKAAGFLEDGFTAITNRINGYVGTSENSCMAADYAQTTTTNPTVTANAVPGAMTGAMAAGGFIGGMAGNYAAGQLAQQWNANYKMSGVLSAIGTSVGTVAGT
ncbi:MAG: conjugal transfer protein TraN, partial [Methylococcaceae bacterium]